MRKKEKLQKPLPLYSPQNKIPSGGIFKANTSKNYSPRHQLTPGRRERLLKVLTKEKAKDSLVLKYLQDRISKVKKGENSGLDVSELEILEQEIKKRFPQQKITIEQPNNKEKKQEVLQEIKQNEDTKNQDLKINNLEGNQLKEKWRNEKQAKTLNPNDDASPKSIYEIGDDQDEYDLIVKYNTEQYKRNLQQQFIEKKKQQQLLGESYSQQIEHKKLQKQLEDLQSKRIKEQFDKDVLKYKQEQFLDKMKEKEKIKKQSNMIKESLDNYNQKKKLQNSLIFNEGVEYQGQASRAVQQEIEEKRSKKQYEFQFYKQLENLTEEEKLKALQKKIQDKEEERKLLQDRVQQFNRMDQERYKDKEKVQQKANIIENIIAPSAGFIILKFKYLLESHFSTKTQKIANQELLSMKQAYILDEQEKQKEYERKYKEKELQKQINSILDLQIKQKEAQKQQDKCDDIQQSNIFRFNDREYLVQQNQIDKSIKLQNLQHAEQLRKQIEADKEKKLADKFMTVNEIIYHKDILKNASRDVSDFSSPLTKRELMLPRIQKNIYHSNLY